MSGQIAIVQAAFVEGANEWQGQFFPVVEQNGRRYVGPSLGMHLVEKELFREVEKIALAMEHGFEPSSSPGWFPWFPWEVDVPEDCRCPLDEDDPLLDFLPPDGYDYDDGSNGEETEF